jgi:hypothetical protein
VKNRIQNEELLEAVLFDEPAQEASLRVVRRSARRRRWSRYARNSAVILVVLAASLTLLQPNRSEIRNPAALPTGEAPYIVHSRALPKEMMVRTQEKSVAMVTTLRTGVEFFTTVSTRPPERIDDEMLLQLAPGAVLVRHQSGAAELVFPNRPEPALESRSVSE